MQLQSLQLSLRGAKRRSNLKEIATASRKGSRAMTAGVRSKNEISTPAFGGIETIDK
jgi:hypothetical protein